MMITIAFVTSLMWHFLRKTGPVVLAKGYFFLRVPPLPTEFYGRLLEDRCYVWCAPRVLPLYMFLALEITSEIKPNLHLRQIWSNGVSNTNVGNTKTLVGISCKNSKQALVLITDSASSNQPNILTFLAVPVLSQNIRWSKFCFLY